MAKLSGAVTVAGAVTSEFKGIEQFVAPEVLANGIGVSSAASDVYALCATLRLLFEGNTQDFQEKKALEILDGELARLCCIIPNLTNSSPFGGHRSSYAHGLGHA